MTAPTFANLTANGGSGATSFTTASISPTGNRLVLLSVHAYISTGSVAPSAPTVTGGGMTTWTQVGTGQDIDTAGTDRAKLFVFRSMQASPGSAAAVTISFGATSMTRCVWSVDQSDANVNTQGTNGAKAISQITGVTVPSGTTASVNFVSTMEAKNSAFSAWGHQTNEQMTPRSGWTELADTFPVSLASVETQYIAGTDTAGSASWTTSSRAGGILLEIVAPPVLLLAYDYNEASGDVLDKSGNSRSFTPDTSVRTAAGGGYTYGGTRPSNKGLSQNTTAVQVGPSTTGMLSPRRTMMTWAKAGGSDPSWFLEWHDTAGNTGVFGWLTLSGVFRGRMKETPSNTAHDITLTADATNYHHWALTYDGTTFAAYKDGTLVSSVASLAFAASDTIYIFDTPGLGVTLSDTRFYDDALDAATISSLKDTPLSAAGASVTLSLATETDAANVLSNAKTVTVGSAAEAETAFALSVTKTRAVTLGMATEADASYSVVAARAIGVSRATETDAALALSVTKTRTVVLGSAAETDAAFQVMYTAEGASTLGVATELSQAQSLTQTKALILGVATEDDEAFFLTSNGETTFSLDRAQETSAGLDLVAVKLVTLGVAAEIEASYGLDAVHANVIVLDVATEISSAHAMIVPTTNRNITIIALGEPTSAWATSEPAIQTVMSGGDPNVDWVTTAPGTDWITAGPVGTPWVTTEPEL